VPEDPALYMDVLKRITDLHIFAWDHELVHLTRRTIDKAFQFLTTPEIPRLLPPMAFRKGMR
jgi:hypothetical protein